MPISKLGQRRQVVIPKGICDALGMEIGDFVEVTEAGGSVIIKPKKLVDLEDTLTPEEEAQVREGIDELQRGEVKPWSVIKHELDV